MKARRETCRFCLNIYVHFNLAAGCSMFLHNSSMKTLTLTYDCMLFSGQSKFVKSLQARHFSPLQSSGPRSVLWSGYRGLSPLGSRGRCVKLTTCLSEVPLYEWLSCICTSPHHMPELIAHEQLQSYKARWWIDILDMPFFIFSVMKGRWDCISL